MDWAQEEFKTMSLGDERLNQRGQKLLAQLSKNPTDSVPVACGTAIETKSAYRFFDNPQVSPEKILEPHYDSTLLRMSEQPVILIAQDTTVLNFSGQREREDTGPTTKESSKGMYLHCALATTPEKINLGVLYSKTWYRKKLLKLSKQELKELNYSTPIEKKESYRWLENYKLANTYAEILPDTQIVSLADREGDIYDIYEEAEKLSNNSSSKAFYLIRARHDRSLCTKEGKKTYKKMRSTLIDEGFLGETCIEISSTSARKGRKAIMQVYSLSVNISLPYMRKKCDNYKPVSVTTILCVEKNPPKGEKSIEWLLITNLSVDSYDSACEKIQWYTCRWQIEIFFKTLKSGCRIEKLQLKNQNFSCCLSLYLIVAWRILYLMSLSRVMEDETCEIVFSREEWETVYVVVHKKKPPKKPPKLKDMIKYVASLGGYMNRRSDPDPGVQTIWIGMRNMQEHIKAREALASVYSETYG